MSHVVQWLTEMRVPSRADLTQYYIQIETPEGQYVAGAYVPLGRTSYTLVTELAPGDYVETVAARTADGLGEEGRIARPFTIGGEPPPVDPPPVGEPALFPFPIWGDPYVPPVLEPGEVDKQLWDDNMITYGVIHGDYLDTEPPPIVDHKINHVYYDMCRVMYQIADYTETPEPWNGYAKKAMQWYRDDYLLPNNGGLPGYQNFSTGLRMDYERTGDEESKRAAILLSTNAAFTADTTDPTWTTDQAVNREVAYAILSYINAEKLGEPRREVRALRVNDAYGHCAQWLDRSRWGTADMQPFMWGITAQVLIADWEETQDARCLPTLQALADFMWPLAWDAETSALYYQINPDCAGGVSTAGAPDLNLIVAPWLAWLWVQTGDPTYRDQFDVLLYGSRNAWLGAGKQFDQNYWWSFAGMAWRES